ncbi:MAG: anti-sigma factor [Erythrobacter sp.]
MSDEKDIKRDDPIIAAEFSLGLLEGEELLAARGKLATDKSFEWRKDWWDDWFVPLSDGVAGAEPSDEVWQRITAAIAAQSGGDVLAGPTAARAANDDGAISDLKTRLRRWQWTAAITSTAAAVALAVMVFAPGSSPAPDEAPLIATADPLMATVPIGDTGLRLDVTYMPESERMMVTAIGLSADGVHDHELWLVPEQGDLQSLGVVTPGEVVSVNLPEDITRNILDGSQVLLTREPLGGKPVDQDAGPVVAQGAFQEV